MLISSNNAQKFIADLMGEIKQNQIKIDKLSQYIIRLCEKDKTLTFPFPLRTEEDFLKFDASLIEKVDEFIKSINNLIEI